jgi:ATP-binding cassette subfamily F protein 3
MSSQEVLQEAMAQYDGFVLVVSHNRYFLDSFVNKVIEVKDHRVSVFEGNISDYLRKIGEDEEEQKKVKTKLATAEPTKRNEKKQQLSRKEQRKQEAKKRTERNKTLGPLKRQSEEAEKKVEQLETQKTVLEEKMADPELYQDQEAWASTSKEYDDTSRKLTRWYEKWETAQEKLEEATTE